MAKAAESAKSTKEEDLKSTFLGEPMVEMTDDEIDELADQEDSFDIFIDVGEKLYKEGDRVIYTIRKDGAFLAGSIKHPFSWDEIHRKYGGGTYQINCRSSRAGKFIKSESRFLADIAVNEEDRPGDEKKASGSNATELLVLFQNMNKETQREAREREEKLERERREERERLEKESERRVETQKNESSSMMTMMMQMMQQSNQQTTALLTALVSGGQKKEEVSIEKIINLMDTRMEKMMERLTPKEKKGDDPYTIIKNMQDAEERGYKKAMDLHTLAEKKAEELADLRSEGGGGAKEESTITKIIDSLSPALSTLMAARGMGMGMPPAPTPAGVPGVNPHRPALPMPRPASVNPKQGTPPLTTRPMGAPPPGAPQTAPARQPVGGPASAAQGSKPASIQPKPAMGAPAAPVTAQPKKEMSHMDTRVLIESTVLDEMKKDLGAHMLTPQKLNPEKAAENCLQILKPFGIDAKALCSQYSLDDMLKVAKAKGVPDAIKPYLERFHAHIQAQTPVDTGSRPTGGESNDS